MSKYIRPCLEPRATLKTPERVGTLIDLATPLCMPVSVTKKPQTDTLGQVALLA